MSQPPPLPPQFPMHPQRSPSIIGPLLGGAALTILATIGISCGSIVFPGSVTDNVFVMIGFICLVSGVAGLGTVVWLRRNPALRGWSIGVLVGLGLVMGFWAIITLFLIILVINTPPHR